MLEDKKKVTEEEITQIKELQSAYLQVTYDLGQLAIDKLDLQNKLDKNEEAQKEAANHLGVLKEQEEQLSFTLQEKYGSTTIDLETGSVG